MNEMENDGKPRICINCRHYHRHETFTKGQSAGECMITPSYGKCHYEHMQVGKTESCEKWEEAE